ncbi:tripartite tricarboxylate transporter substrate binding protein [Ramlibacter henchirensis]|uniref:Tripartite tricarboxylate transporter substrate binding protein n=2 Tax=Ramlibacter henchirensis TaxID=204072 RepID=A0A4Z0BXY4_9BURK|nr:tripartite tricarboxylate transporter substrate binding protein [Ramlibacter henchirensis]
MAGCLAASGAFAQNYPTKPIRMLVAGAAGGSSDVQARLIAQEMYLRLRQTVVVENYGGAGGMIAAEMVVKAPADGYTLLFGYQGPLAANVSMFKNMSYDPLKDFSLITMVSFAPSVLAVNPTQPVNTVGELVKLAQASPGKYNYASGGQGTGQHLSGELFQMVTGVKLNHVPYKGDAPAIADVVAGHVPMTFTSLVSAIPQAQAGKLRLLAVTSSKRSPMLPEVPTMAEAGYPNYEIVSWFAIAAPRGTPREIVNKLNATIVDIIKSPAVTSRIVSLGGMPAPMTPDEFTRFLEKDIPRWGDLIRRANAQVN